LILVTIKGSLDDAFHESCPWDQASLVIQFYKQLSWQSATKWHAVVICPTHQDKSDMLGFKKKECILLCVQVLKSQLSQFKERVLAEYRESEAYSGLRNDSQRIRSIAVLEYLLDRGGEKARRCELHDQFVIGGSSRKRSPQDLDESTPFESPAFPMNNWQFQRILERLEYFKFVERSEVTPPSNRTKGRKKQDVYYSISINHITWEDLGRDPQADKELLDTIRQVYVNPFFKTEMIRKELLEIDLKSISSKELEEKLQGYAHFIVHINNDLISRWARGIPDSDKRLRTMLFNYLRRGGHTYWAYTPPSSQSSEKLSP